MGFGGFKKKLGFAKKAFGKAKAMNPILGRKKGGSGRSEAAESLIREDVTKQAGSGQVKYTNEYRV